MLITAWDIAHRNTEIFAVPPAKTVASGGVPTGLNANITQADYVAWTRNQYDAITGALIRIDDYHNIPSSGAGSLGTSFNSTYLLYTPTGKDGATILYVDMNRYQVTARLYNIHDRLIETRRGISTSVPTSYDVLDDALSSTPTGFLGYAKVQDVQYDHGGVGDGYVTSIKSYHGAAANDYMETVLHRTFRGHVRGIERRSSSGDITPYTAMDVNWFGETTASAIYSSEPNWSTLEGGYAAYVNDASGSTGRNNLTVTFCDALGRVYRTYRYPGTENTNHFEINNFYDRRDFLVATGDKYRIHIEYAYDGASRQYQSRTVKTLSSTTPYSSGAFVYVAPAPKPDFASMTGGSAGVIELSHIGFDAGANVIEKHSVELNHDNSNGFSLSGGTPSGGVRSTLHNYFDAADRLITSADYGSGKQNDGAVNWRASELPNRDTGDPTTLASSTNRLVTQYGYDTGSGRLTLFTDPDGIKTKTFYDASGHRIAVAENWVDYSASSDTGAGGGTNNQEDRVTKWLYNGLGQVTELVAVNVTSFGTVDQETQYYYEDSYDASLATHTVYPDSTSTPFSGTDLVKSEYNLDGTLKKQTDQRGVVTEYSYDSARRAKAERVTSFGASGIVDETVKSITRKYDNLGRVEKVTSHGNATDDPDNTASVQNQIRYTYGAVGRVIKTEQSHSGVVTTGTPFVQYTYDADADTTTHVYKNGLRLQTVTYPNNRVVYNDYGTLDGILDRLGRIFRTRETSGTGTILAEYSYNGTSRLVISDYSLSSLKVKLDLFGGTAGTYAGLDRFSRTVDHRWINYSGTLTDVSRVRYGYDYGSNRTWREDTVAAANSQNHDEFYTYDGLRRLANFDRGDLAGTWPNYTGISSTPGREEDWTLDQLGNWPGYVKKTNDTTTLNQTRYHNSVNEIDGDGGNSITASTGTDWADPAYDGAGNMIVMPQLLDPAASYEVTYDAWNRLVNVNQGSDVVTMQYDGLGRRITKHVPYPSWETYHYYYNEQWQLLEERKNTSNNPLAQYVWHPYYIDSIAVQYYDVNTSGTQVRQWYLQDANFNVTAVVNDSGAVLERYAYTPYGEVTFLNQNFTPISGNVTQIGNTHLYTGRECDPETGVQINRYRYCPASVGTGIFLRVR